MSQSSDKAQVVLTSKENFGQKSVFFRTICVTALVFFLISSEYWKAKKRKIPNINTIKKKKVTH